jgi:hypothetical protein
MRAATLEKTKQIDRRIRTSTGVQLFDDADYAMSASALQ